jgi:5'-deoxynucleotidase YfbR-like HD superfamily hydrolase
MWTASGQLFDILAFDPWAITLEDVAHGLSNICRFGGHTVSFYSVAQHSVLVSQLCDTADGQIGLLHDATEAYLGDIISPLKRQPGMEVYRDIEAKMADAVAIRFGVPGMETPSVDLADRLAVFLEMRDLMRGTPMKYGLRVARPDLSVLGVEVVPLPPPEAKALFLARAEELGIR